MIKTGISISLFGPFGSGNLGDAAIQDAVIYNIKKHLPFARIFAFSHNPEDTQARHRIKTFPISRPAISDLSDELIINRKSLVWLRNVPLAEKMINKIQSVIDEVKFFLKSFHILKDIDIFIFSGGGQLDDYWGGPWGHPYMLLRWAFLAKIAGTKIVFLSVGADSIKYRLSRIFIKRALLLSDYRSYRECVTRMYVENLGIKKRNFVFPDPAYSLHINGGIRLNMTSSGQKTIGISPIAAAACPNVSESHYENYLDELVSLSCQLLRKKYEILFIPSQVLMDSPIISRVVRKVKDRCGSDFSGKIVEGQISDLNEFLHLVSRVDMVIASRLHGVLLSSLMYKPILAISCNRKVEILMSDLEFPEYCVDIHNFNSIDAIQFMVSLDNDRESIIRHLQSKVRLFKTALDQQYKSLFADYAAN